MIAHARRRGALVALGLLVAGCAAASGPRIIELRDLPRRPTYDLDWITTDRAAAAVAVAVMEEQLKLPRHDVTMYFLRDRETFRQALLAEGYDASFAHDTSQRLDAIAGPGRVFFNADALTQLTAPQRTGFFAHELTHTLQYHLGGGVRGTSDQWLREGFADWVASRVMAAVGVATLNGFRQPRVRMVRQASAVPPLDGMATFPDWVSLLDGVNAAVVTAAAFLAVEVLIERHGVDAVLDYFSRFAARQDRLGNFAAAFGEPLSAFEHVFREHLQQVR